MAGAQHMPLLNIRDRAEKVEGGFSMKAYLKKLARYLLDIRESLNGLKQGNDITLSLRNRGPRVDGL